MILRVGLRQVLRRRHHDVRHGPRGVRVRPERAHHRRGAQVGDRAPVAGADLHQAVLRRTRADEHDPRLGEAEDRPPVPSTRRGLSRPRPDVLERLLPQGGARLRVALRNDGVLTFFCSRKDPPGGYSLVSGLTGRACPVARLHRSSSERERRSRAPYAKGYVDAALYLTELKAAGKIKAVGVTNFDTERVAQMVDAGAEIATNQIQYSLLDRRPEKIMVPYFKAGNEGAPTSSPPATPVLFCTHHPLIGASRIVLHPCRRFACSRDRGVRDPIHRIKASGSSPTVSSRAACSPTNSSRFPVKT